MAQGHAEGKPVSAWQLDSLAGAGAMVSSATDLLKFAQAHWSPNTPARLQAAMKLAAQAHYKNTTGLAWNRDKGALKHDGGTGGFRSSLELNVSKQTAFVTLQNGFSTGSERIHKGDYTSVQGLWTGTLPIKSKLRLAFHILPEGSAVLYSLNQGSTPIPSGTSEFIDGELFIRFPSIDGTLQVKFMGKELVGTWSQGTPLKVTLTSTNQLPKKLQKTLQKRMPDDLDSLVGFWSGEIAVANLFVYLEVSLKVPLIGGSFSADLTEDKTINGTWSQGTPLKLDLKKTTERPFPNNSVRE